MKITVTIPDHLVEALDRRRTEEPLGLNRSQWICSLILDVLEPVDNSESEVDQPSASRLAAVCQPSRSRLPAVSQPSASRLADGHDRSIDRLIEREKDQDCLKNEQPPCPTPPPGRLEKKSESMIPGEVQALKAEYLHHAPDLVEEVLQFIAERESRRYLPPDRQLLALQAWKWKPGDPPKEWAMSRRVWALRTVMKNRKTVTDPEAYMLSLLERGPKQPRPPDRNQTALALGGNNEPPEWKELREKWVYVQADDMFAPRLVTGAPDWQSGRRPRPEGMPKPRPPDPCCQERARR